MFAFVLVFTLLMLFFAARALHLPFLEETPDFMLGQEKWVAGVLGIGLLIADVVAPVPSSVIMFANGVLFGLFWGATFSTLGGMGAAFVAYWIGTRTAHTGRRWMGDESLSRVNGFFVKYGMMAVIVSRPVPILAEAIGIIAGISRMPADRFLPAALLGILPTAIIYAAAGVRAADFHSSAYIFLSVIALAGAVWIVGRVAVKFRS
jgi:uncharacterized membrane protein YdjX (TVP38/TMEM64 family)